jgi:coenzyme F420-reducing hydrogenase alpha subunit
MLWHRYAIDDDGTILDAKIVPPTSQNQAGIEQSLRGFVQQHVELDDDELRLRCEQAVRSYDPCISCATHFLRLDIDRA